MRSAFAYLAARRLIGVALAVAVEVAVLLALTRASSASIVGIPAAVAAAIGGTLAVVLGPLDGVAVVLVGAIVFGSVEGWGPGELAALGVWPGIVLAAGLFARGVERQRAALGQVVAAQELERQRLALELHDETAQALVAALLTLRQGEQTASHALIEETIQAVRSLAVELRPKVLDDFGLVPAVERLAATLSERTGIHVDVAADRWSGRPSGDVELTLYRVVQDALASSTTHGAREARIVLERRPGKAAVAIDADGGAHGAVLDALRERVRLLGGRLEARGRGPGSTSLRVEIPVAAGGSPLA